MQESEYADHFLRATIVAIEFYLFQREQRHCERIKKKTVNRDKNNFYKKLNDICGEGSEFKYLQPLKINKISATSKKNKNSERERERERNRETMWTNICGLIVFVQ